VREGWQSYLKDPKATNQQMHQLNPTMDLDTFAEVAEVQKQFIVTSNGLGTMSRERWETLITQFKDLGDISQTIPPEDCFRQL
jgi:NitT/TauT family transport system substrate-binding protein